MKIACLACLVAIFPLFVASSSGSSSLGDGKDFKIVIIRADDIYSINPEIKWLSDLALKDDLKVTYAVIPARLNSSDIAYLRKLDRYHFELAAHGYNHESLKGLPYEKQYNIINASTKAMSSYFRIRPHTFIPPFEAVDSNTIKACYDLGYHSILMPYDTQNAHDMMLLRKFSWESQWRPLKHFSFMDFKKSFDSYYNSTARAFLIILHPNTFNIDKKLNQSLVEDFNKSIYYMKAKKVKFETLENMYQWIVNDKRFRCFAYQNKSFFEI